LENGGGSVCGRRKRPGQISYASSGTFGSSHLAAEMAAKAAHAKLLHVPYRGGAPSMTALLSHDVDFTIQSPIVASQNIAAAQFVLSPQPAANGCHRCLMSQPFNNRH